MNLRLLAQPCALLLIGNPVIANGTTFKQIMLKVPRSTNAMVLIDVERTLSSPLTEKEGSGTRKSSNFPATRGGEVGDGCRVASRRQFSAPLGTGVDGAV